MLGDPCGEDIEIAANNLVRDAKNPDAERPNRSVAMPVDLPAKLMRRSVELDNEPGGFAVEVRDVIAYDLLAAKMKSRDFAASQCEPQTFLRRRHPAAQRFGKGELLGTGGLIADDWRASF